MLLEEYNQESKVVINKILIGVRSWDIDQALNAGQGVRGASIIYGFGYFGDHIKIYKVDCDAVRYNMAKGGAIEEYAESFKRDGVSNYFGNGRFKLVDV